MGAGRGSEGRRAQAPWATVPRHARQPRREPWAFVLCLAVDRTASCSPQRGDLVDAPHTSVTAVLRTRQFSRRPEDAVARLTITTPGGGASGKAAIPHPAWRLPSCPNLRESSQEAPDVVSDTGYQASLVATRRSPMSGSRCGARMQGACITVTLVADRSGCGRLTITSVPTLTEHGLAALLTGISGPFGSLKPVP